MQSVATKERSVWCSTGTLKFARLHHLQHTTCECVCAHSAHMVIYCCRAVVYALLQIFSKFIRTYGVTNSLFRHIVCLHCCEIRRRCRFSTLFFLSSVVAFFFSLCAHFFVSRRKMWTTWLGFGQPKKKKKHRKISIANGPHSAHPN